MVKLYKERIDRLNLDLKILYICDCSFAYPLKPETIDIFIDFYSSNEYASFNKDYYLEKITPLFNRDVSFLAHICILIRAAVPQRNWQTSTRNPMKTTLSFPILNIVIWKTEGIKKNSQKLLVIPWIPVHIIKKPKTAIMRPFYFMFQMRKCIYTLMYGKKNNLNFSLRFKRLLLTINL